MIEMRKNKLATAIFAALSISASKGAHAAAIGSFSITGGTFAMGLVTPDGPIAYTNLSGADLAAGYVAPAWNTQTNQTGPAAGAIMSFNFGGPFMNYYTAASSTQVDGGGPVVNGTFGGGSITVDLSSLFGHWMASDIDMGNAAVTGTTSNGTSFSIGWTIHWTVAGGGPFPGLIGTNTATGTLSAVPVPAAAWLMGSGLLGLAGIVRRRKAK